MEGMLLQQDLKAEQHIFVACILCLKNLKLFFFNFRGLPLL